MNKKWIWQDCSRRLSYALGATAVGALLPLVAFGNPVATSPECDALVAITNNLYLVDGSGRPLTQFTSDGLAKDQPTVAPDGRRVAWLVAGPSDSTYTILDSSGHQVTLNPHATDRPGDDQAAAPLMALAWSSADVVQLTKHEGPSASRFEYHQIGSQTSSAPLVGQLGAGTACAQHGEVACVQDGEIQVSGSPVFDQAPNTGATPQTSVTLAKGSTAVLSGTPAFTVQILGFSGDTIGLQVTGPNGTGAKEWVPAGVPLNMDWKFITYSFTATQVDPQAGTVRVDEFVDGDQPAAFDPAITWSLEGHDLLAVYRSNGQAVLYLVRPGSQGSSWSLTAQVPLSITAMVDSMRFVSPSTLLLHTADGKFSELPVTITQGQSGHGPALMLGAVNTLPQSLQVVLDPAAPAAQAKVLDWACDLSHGQ